MRQEERNKAENPDTVATAGLVMKATRHQPEEESHHRPRERGPRTERRRLTEMAWLGIGMAREHQLATHTYPGLASPQEERRRTTAGAQMCGGL